MRTARAYRVSRSLRGPRSGAGGRWELPLLAAIATFILTIGSVPFIAPANGWRYLQKARFDWVAPASAVGEEVRAVPQVGLARIRNDGNYRYTPDMVFATMHLVRPASWQRYQDEYLGGNLHVSVRSDDLVLDEQSAHGLNVAVGDRVAVLAFFGVSAAAPVEVRVGGIVPSYVEPGTSESGLLAVTGRGLGAAAVSALAPQGRAWRFGIGPQPDGGRTRSAMMAEFLSRLVSSGAGPAASGTVLLGVFLWWIAIARYARRLVEHDRRAVALLVLLGCRARIASAIAALPVVAVGIASLAAGAAVCARAVLALIQGRYVSLLAFAPLAVLMALVTALAAYRSYRGLLVRVESAHLAACLTEES